MYGNHISGGNRLACPPACPSDWTANKGGDAIVNVHRKSAFVILTGHLGSRWPVVLLAEKDGKGNGVTAFLWLHVCMSGWRAQSNYKAKGGIA